jgi:hypothetical protein
MKRGKGKKILFFIPFPLLDKAISQKLKKIPNKKWYYNDLTNKRKKPPLKWAVWLSNRRVITAYSANNQDCCSEVCICEYMVVGC